MRNHKDLGVLLKELTPRPDPWSFLKLVKVFFPFNVKGGDPAALSSTATLLRLHPPH